MACWAQSQQPELRMGTFVRAAIEGRYMENAVVLPRYVLRNDNTVLVANQERELEVREVTVAARGARSRCIISAGVAGGELVITTTLDAPIPGTRLVISSEHRRRRTAVAVDTTDVEPVKEG